MMQFDIDELCNKALEKLKTYSNFPKKGFIAGGSLANIIWEMVSGNPAKINDIDVFILDKIIDRNPNDTSNWVNPKSPESKKLFYHKKEVVYFEDYKGLSSTLESRDFYYIEKTEHSDIYNFVYYSANKSTPQIIIDSFDINCTQIGYSIEEKKFYYTKDFIDFIRTGELKLVNLMSPAHSAIRLVKKKNELSAKLDDLELKLCQYCLLFGMYDTVRRYFTPKYSSIYKEYESELSKFFLLEKEEGISDIINSKKGLELEIFSLRPNINVKIDPIDSLFDDGRILKTRKIFDDEEEINRIHTGQRLLFYVRNIKNDEYLKSIWRKLNLLYKVDDYVDCHASKEDIDMLERMVKIAPNTIENMKGLRLSQQLSIMKTLFEKYKDDPIVAIAIMEKMKIDPDKDFDEGDLLLLELSVRKEIVNDTKQKALRTLNPDKVITRHSQKVEPYLDIDDIF